MSHANYSSAAPTLPASPWKGELMKFAAMHGKQAWAELPDNEKDYFTSLQVKMEPIICLQPAFAQREPIVGFECLALGPNAEGHAAILKRAEASRIDRGFIELLLALVQIQAAESLRSEAALYNTNSANAANRVVFTLNVSVEMLNNQSFYMILQRSKQLGCLLELMEQHSQYEALLELKHLHDIRFVIDDRNAWKHESVAKKLGNVADWIKIDFKYFQAARSGMAGATDASSFKKQLLRFSLDGKPLVIEGISGRSDISLVQSFGEEADPSYAKPSAIYGQGYGVGIGDPWTRWLLPLSAFGSTSAGWIRAPQHLTQRGRAATKKGGFKGGSGEQWRKLKRETPPCCHLSTAMPTKFSVPYPALTGLL